MGIDHGKAVEAGERLMESPMRYVTGLKKLGHKNTFRFGSALFIIFAFMVITIESGS